MPKPEIKALALADLDIEELDRRIELAPATGSASEWGCTSNCPVNCSQVCEAYFICGSNIAGAQ